MATTTKTANKRAATAKVASKASSKKVTKASQVSAKASKGKEAVKTATRVKHPQERSWGLSKEEIAELLKLKMNSRNPFREGSSYHAVTQVLLTRFGTMVALDKIIAEYPKVIGAEAFRAFKAKAARNENGKDYQSRIQQNLDVVGREKDYGLCLVQLGMEVKREKSDKGISYGLFQRGRQRVG